MILKLCHQLRSAFVAYFVLELNLVKKDSIFRNFWILEFQRNNHGPTLQSGGVVYPQMETVKTPNS